MGTLLFDMLMAIDAVHRFSPPTSGTLAGRNAAKSASCSYGAEYSKGKFYAGTK
jgi:hypothetical protein